MQYGKMAVHIFLLALSVLFAFKSFAQSRTSAASSISVPLYSFGPVTDYNAAQRKTSDVLWFRRGERYNIPDPSVPELAQQVDPDSIVDSTASYYQDPMPFTTSDAVVTGAITSGQAYLSNDKRDFYSEFTTVVQEVLKSPAAYDIRMGNTIDVERKGGSIRLPSGRIVVRGFTDLSMPLVGKRYLLFLKYDQSAEDFHIVTAYQLEGQHTYLLDELGSSPAERRHNAFIHPLREHSDNEQLLLNQARNAAKTSGKSGM